METTGEIIRRNIPKNLKRDGFAALLDVSPQYVSNLLSNKKKPSSKLLERIINILAISDEDIEKIKKFEETRNKLKEAKIRRYSYSREGLKMEKIEEIFSKGDDIFNAIEKASVFVCFNDDFIKINKNDIIVFKEYENEKINNNYAIIKNEIYFVRKIDEYYILEGYKEKVLKNIDFEYIASYIIRRGNG